MNSEVNTYKKGDWIVHIFFGLGQVIGIDKRTLDGEKQNYLRVKTSENHYWIPVVNVDINRVRPVAMKNQIKYAFTLVQRPPKKLSRDYMVRRKEISQKLNKVSLYSNVRLIRDLKGRRATSKFNMNDDNVLKNIMKQFLDECVLVMDEEHKTVENKLNNALTKSIEKIN